MNNFKYFLLGMFNNSTRTNTTRSLSSLKESTLFVDNKKQIFSFTHCQYNRIRRQTSVLYYDLQYYYSSERNESMYLGGKYLSMFPLCFVLKHVMYIFKSYASNLIFNWQTTVIFQQKLWPYISKIWCHREIMQNK